MTQPRICVRWTPKDETRAVELYRSGARLKTIGAILDRTPDSVRTRLQVLRKKGLVGSRRKPA